MKVNFLQTDCQEPSRTDEVFGICDDQDGTKAYTDVRIAAEWIATVKNPQRRYVAFTAIDHCISVFKPGTQDKESTCDGMLTFTDRLYLVELKKQRTGGWLPDAMHQLENTIRLLGSSHDLSKFKQKKAFACNRKHPKFQELKFEYKKAFLKKTGFILHVEAEIVIK